MRVPVVELRRRVGTRRSFRQAVVLDLPAVAETHLRPGTTVDVDLELESVLEGVMVTGTIRAPWVAACRRCLEPVTGVVAVAVRELFEPGSTPGETYPLEDDHIDLEPLVREAVLLALPLSPLCREGCRGPDPERFPTLAPDAPDPGAGVAADAPAPEDPAEAPGDPRWAALRELRFDS
jgi:uncharacterized protein